MRGSRGRRERSAHAHRDDRAFTADRRGSSRSGANLPGETGARRRRFCRRRNDRHTRARFQPEALGEPGQQFVVDNRTGAGGTIGTEAVAKAPPDGYTINFGSTSSLAVSPNLYPKLPYDLLRDSTPVTQVATASIMLAVHPSVPAKNMRELIALARARPGQINYASSGNGSSLHLCAEYLKYLAKIDMTHVPYKGVGHALPDLIAGHVQLLFSDMAPFVPYVKTGRLKVLAASTAQRSKLYPEFPTIAESGVPGYDLAGWYGVVVPAATPRAIVERLHAEYMKAMRAPDMAERYATLGVEPVDSTPEQFGAYMRAELAKWGDIIKRSGTRLE